MARVDFYVLQRADERSRHTLACKLAEKAYRLENTVYIHARNREDATKLDELLWTFRDGSFVPHALSGIDGDTAASPVTIGCDADNVPARDLLINLCDVVPTFSKGYKRIAEIVPADDDARAAGRKRFKQYRDLGMEPATHNIE